VPGDAALSLAKSGVASCDNSRNLELGRLSWALELDRNKDGTPEALSATARCSSAESGLLLLAVIIGSNSGTCFSLMLDRGWITKAGSSRRAFTIAEGSWAVGTDAPCSAPSGMRVGTFTSQPLSSRLKANGFTEGKAASLLPVRGGGSE